MRLLTMPPITVVASGFITSAPVRVLHMMGSRLAPDLDRLQVQRSDRIRTEPDQVGADNEPLVRARSRQTC